MPWSYRRVAFTFSGDSSRRAIQILGRLVYILPASQPVVCSQCQLSQFNEVDNFESEEQVVDEAAKAGFLLSVYATPFLLALLREIDPTIDTAS